MQFVYTDNGEQDNVFWLIPRPVGLGLHSRLVCGINCDSSFLEKLDKLWIEPCISRLRNSVLQEILCCSLVQKLDFHANFSIRNERQCWTILNCILWLWGLCPARRNGLYLGAKPGFWAKDFNVGNSLGILFVRMCQISNWGSHISSEP